MYARRTAALLLIAASLVLAPSPAGASSAAGAGGGNSGDMTVDREPDILARVAADGRLVVYPRVRDTVSPPVTINTGWGGMRWIASADINATGVPFKYQSDVVSIDQGGVMRVALHTGTFDGTRTLAPQVVVGSGWQLNDLIHPTYHLADSSLRANLIARRKGTGDVYLYENTGQLGPNLFKAPVRVFTGRQNDVWEAVDNFTGDARPDLLFVDTAGRLGVFDPAAGTTTWLGTGWNTVDSIALVHAPDSYDSIMARRISDGALLSYHRTTHEWQPAPDGTAYQIYAAPVVLGTGWHTNDIIT